MQASGFGGTTARLSDVAAHEVDFHRRRFGIVKSTIRDFTSARSRLAARRRHAAKIDDVCCRWESRPDGVAELLQMAKCRHAAREHTRSSGRCGRGGIVRPDAANLNLNGCSTGRSPTRAPSSSDHFTGTSRAPIAAIRCQETNSMGPRASGGCPRRKSGGIFV